MCAARLGARLPAARFLLAVARTHDKDIVFLLAASAQSGRTHTWEAPNKGWKRPELAKELDAWATSRHLG